MRIFRTLRDAERGQILPIMALLAVAFIGLLGLAIDGGRLYVAKAELSRALDSAALAGVVELPDQNEAESTASAYLAEHLPDASVSFPAPIEGAEFRVGGTRTIGTVFMSVFGFDDVEIDGVAAAGFGAIAVDAVLAIDSTGSMGAAPCNRAQNNSGCPIHEAKEASSLFADTLLAGGSGDSLVGVVPYRGCYKPDRQYENCVPAPGWIINLTANIGLIHGKIRDVSSQGGSGTNVCLGLRKANEVLFGPGAHTASSTRRYIVLLSDGDNTYNANSYGTGQPPVDCRPSSDPQNSDGYVGASCRGAQTRERSLDEKTFSMANAIKSANGAEIFVVGFGVCGSSSASLCNTGMIGGGSHDNSADRNLLKCIASSSGGTNDHYYEVASASDLPEVFQQIAQVISFRLVE